MKAIKFFLMACLVVCGVTALAADDMPIKKMSVEAVITSAPDVAYRHHNAFAPKNPSISKWLMIKVKYTMDQCRDFTPDVRVRKKSGTEVLAG